MAQIAALCSLPPGNRSTKSQIWETSVSLREEGCGNKGSYILRHGFMCLAGDELYGDTLPIPLYLSMIRCDLHDNARRGAPLESGDGKIPLKGNRYSKEVDAFNVHTLLWLPPGWTAPARSREGSG